MRAEDRLKEKLKELPFGSEAYIKTLANIIYLRKDIVARMYAADLCLMGFLRVYGPDEADKQDAMLKEAHDLLTESRDPGLCLIAAICLVAEGKEKTYELI